MTKQELYDEKREAGTHSWQRLVAMMLGVDGFFIGLMLVSGIPLRVAIATVFLATVACVALERLVLNAVFNTEKNHD